MFQPDAHALPMLATLLAAAVLEETGFRAGLQHGLMAVMASGRFARIGQALPGRFTPANWLVAVAFALAHGLARSWWLALGVLGPALLLGWIYERRQSLSTCVAVHAAMNAAWWAAWWAVPSGARTWMN